MEIQKKITIAFSFLFLATTSVCQAKFYNTTAGRYEGSMPSVATQSHICVIHSLSSQCLINFWIFLPHHYPYPF